MACLPLFSSIYINSVQTLLATYHTMKGYKTCSKLKKITIVNIKHDDHQPNQYKTSAYFIDESYKSHTATCIILA